VDKKTRPTSGPAGFFACSPAIATGVKKGRTRLPLRKARRNYFDAAGAAAAEAASEAAAFLALCAFLAGAEADAGAEAMAEAEADTDADAGAAKAEAANREATRAAMILDILISSWLR